MQASVSLNPYFRVHPGNSDAARKLLDRFVSKTSTEAGCLYYEFTRCQDIIFCREAYRDAAGVLAHLENVGPELEEVLRLADLIRIEIHGPAAELDRLRGPLAHLPVEWFVWQCGVARP